MDEVDNVGKEDDDDYVDSENDVNDDYEYDRSDDQIVRDKWSIEGHFHRATMSTPKYLLRNFIKKKPNQTIKRYSSIYLSFYQTNIYIYIYIYIYNIISCIDLKLFQGQNQASLLGFFIST